MRDERRHRGVETVELAQLDRETFGQVARANARRVKFLQHAQHRLYVGKRRAELFRHRQKIGRDVAGLVDETDEMLADHPLRRIGDR